MYIEIIIVAVIIFFVCEYSGIVSTSRFVNDYQGVLLRFKESDYDCSAYLQRGITKTYRFNKCR